MKAFAFLALILIIPFSGVFCFEVKEIQQGSSIQPLKWNLAEGPIKITLNAQGSTDLPISSVETAVRNAISTWQKVPGQSMQFQYSGKSSAAVSNNSDQINSIVWVEKDWAYSPSVMAITRYSYFLTDPPVMADADILMNGEIYNWSVGAAGAGKTVHPQQILTHELGHLLGLSHTSVYTASLYPSLPAKLSFAISLDDKAGLQFLYGAPVSDFQPITPLSNATYVDGMTQRGLPLPVFRWGRGPFSDFTLEFSDSTSFHKKVRFAAGNSNSYTLKGSQEQQLLSLSTKKTVYWRVSSGTSATAPRTLRFKQPQAGNFQGSLALIGGQIEEDWKSAFWRAFLALLIALIVVAFAFLLRYWRNAQT